MFMYKNRVRVPDAKGLKDEILAQAHSSRFSVHPGTTKMYHDLKRYYNWTNMERDVAAWVSKCQICQQVKTEHKVPSGLLQNLPLSWNDYDNNGFCHRTSNNHQVVRMSFG